MLPALFVIAVIFICVMVFVSMRAAVRANDQIALLEALLREQKRQNAALKQLIELSSEPVAESVEPEPFFEPMPEADYPKFTAER